MKNRKKKNQISNTHPHLFGKLKSNSGMSLLIALVAFLVAAMVSIVVVAAALTSVKTSKQTQKAMQTKLSIQSAAEYMKNEMDEASYKEVTKYKNGSVDTTDTSMSDTSFQPELYQIIKEINSSTGWESAADQKYTDYYNSTIKTKIKATDSPIVDVTASYVIHKISQESYEVVYTLETDEDGTSQDYATVTFDITMKTEYKNQTGTVIQPDGSGSITETGYTKTDTFIWSFDTINGVGNIKTDD